MIRKLFSRLGLSTQQKNAQGNRVLTASRLMRLESLEDRRMLSAEADIVFLVDKSMSSTEEYTWIGDMVSKEDGLDDYLTDPLRDIDPRYGLIGFGDTGETGALGYGFSHVLDAGDMYPVGNPDGDLLFGDASQLDAIVNNLNKSGSDERVWDSIEHAIAEYEFREGAAVIFVAFRRSDSGTPFAGNSPEHGAVQTHEGILAAMQSYNATLNTVVQATFDSAMFGPDGFVLGVEADETDGDTNGEHIAHVVNGVEVDQLIIPHFLEVSHDGTNSGTFVDTGKSILISTNATNEIAGPNFADYRAESSNEVFDDISPAGSGTGALITDFTPSAEQANQYKQLTTTELGNNFSFNFFGTSYTDLYVNFSGSITFGEPADEYFHKDWEAYAPILPRIAPLWSEYAGYENYGTYWEVKDAGTSSERLIVQWNNYNYTFDSASGNSEAVTFQAVLKSNGDILFSYKDLDVSNPLYTEGKLATVGIATDSFLYPATIPADVFVDGVHNIPGTFNSSNGEIFTGVEDDLVRLSWESGGAAWNNETISGSSSNRNNPVLVAAFDAAFRDSIGDQILRKHASNDVVFADDVLLEIDLGGTPATSSSYISDVDFELQHGSIFPTQPRS